MTRGTTPPGFRLLAGFFLAALVNCGPVLAQTQTQDAPAGSGLLGPGHWRLAVAPFSTHFTHNPKHRYVWALAVERQRDDGYFAGGSYFSNSFGQPSGYAYVGKRWEGWFDKPQLFAQLSGGVLYGYRGEFKNKVPFNHNGWSPGALVTAGWQLDAQRSVALHLLGNSGLMVQLAWDLR